MKPSELTFLTGIESKAVVPIDVASGLSIPVSRGSSSSSRVTVSYTPPTDDILNLNKSGYDTYIDKKGITSTTPVVLAIVPTRNEDVEKSLLTVQRGLTKSCVTATTQMIMDTTGSMSEDQLTEFNAASWPGGFKSVVDSIVASYQSKSNYLQHLDKVFGLQITDPQQYQFISSYISYTSSTSATEGTVTVASGDVSTSVRDVSGFTQTDSTEDWAYNIAGLESGEIVQADLSLNARSNMAVLLQLIRNSIGTLRYGDFEKISADDNSYVLERIESESHRQIVDFLSSIYRSTFDLGSSLTEEIVDGTFSVVAKELSLHQSMQLRGVSGQTIQSYMVEKFGNIAKLDYEQDLSSDRSGGTTFSSILRLEDRGKKIRCIDTGVTSQAFLDEYTTADQYYLIGPLSNDTSLLASRSSEFKAEIQNISSNLLDVKSLLQGTYDDNFVITLMQCISALIGDLFFTAYPTDFGTRQKTASKFILLLKSLEDPTLLNILFKIMMLRDRLINPGDYESSEEDQNVLKIRVKNALISQTDRLTSKLGLTQATSYDPDTKESTVVKGVYYDGDSTLSKGLEIFNFTSPSSTGGASSDYYGVGSNDLATIWTSNVIDVLFSEEQTQYDYFHSYAKNLMNGVEYETISSNGSSNPFDARTDIVDEFITTNRDHRALALYLKAITWFKNASSPTTRILLNFSSYAETESGITTEGQNSEGKSTDKINISMYYDIDVWADIKGLIDKFLSLPSSVTKSSSTSSPDSGTYNITFKFNDYTGFGNDIAALSELVVDTGITGEPTASFSDGVLTVTGTKNFDSTSAYHFNLNIKPVYDGNLRNLIYKTQAVYDACNYVSDWLGQASSLLDAASSNAASYASQYGEKLSSLYTSNSVTNLVRTYDNSLKMSDDFPYYTADYYRNSSYLLGMLNYADYALGSNIEDSFVVVCGIPYGTIERLGGYSLSSERVIRLTLTFRNMNYGTSTVFEQTYTFPASSYIDPSLQKYTDDQLVLEPLTGDSIVDATKLYYLSQDGSLSEDISTDYDVKEQELSSTALLEYLRVLYGLDFSLNSFRQNEDVNVDEQFPYTDSTKSLLENYVASLRLDSLISSRYVNTIGSAKGVQKKKIIKEALAGPVFDKIVAIPISGNLLKNEDQFYLCDLIVSITFENVGDIVVDDTTTSSRLEFAGSVSPGSVDIGEIASNPLMTSARLIT